MGHPENGWVRCFPSGVAPALRVVLVPNPAACLLQLKSPRGKEKKRKSGAGVVKGEVMARVLGKYL
jgi:hypothetical protein